MLGNLRNAASGLSLNARLGLILVTIGAAVSPLVYLLSSPVARADAPEPGAAAPAQKSAPPEFLPPRSQCEQAIFDALGQPTEFDFTETPLQDVVDYLKSRHHIEIQLDSKALEEAGVGSDTPVTRSLKGIPLRSALRLLLGGMDGMNLTFVVNDDILQFTTMEKADCLLSTRTYPVGDLAQDKADYESLMQALVTTIKPVSWDKVGGPASLVVVPRANSLVISHTQDAHDEILLLLRSLRAACKITNAEAAPNDNPFK